MSEEKIAEQEVEAKGAEAKGKLIRVTALKELLGPEDVMVSAEVPAALEAKVEALLKEAVARVKGNGRKKMKAVDL